VDADGRILGVRDTFLHDCGAYDPYGLTVPINSQCTLLGPYDVPSYDAEFRAVFTNRITVTPVRGAGRQHGVFVMERLLDIAAREIGISAAEIRRRNYIVQDDFPHDHKILFQDFQPLVYDSGNYRPALETALELIRWDGFAEEKAAAAADGRRLGIGIVSYVEGTGIGPYEGARVTVEPSGRVRVATGLGTQGQGHYTAFAQIVAEALDVDVEHVNVVTGDTREFNWGTGTFASRGAVVAGSACHAAAVKVREKVIEVGARVLNVNEAEIELSNGTARVRSQPERSITLGDLAMRANPLRGGVTPGSEPGLECTAYFGPDRGSTASGVHAVVVEVDAETAMAKFLRYVVVHDCGKLINPMLVEGQVQGGVAQGIGNASFADYLLPTSLDVPDVTMAHRETPAPMNTLGLKGVGEAGCIPTGAAFAQALEDALSDYEIEITEIPLSPNQLFEILSTAPRRESTGNTVATEAFA
jgi:CO/xanthine dehydrogenase Mo-binding subunit